MSRSTTTTTISVPIEVGYVCSKCGTTNLQKCFITEWADSTRLGTFHTQSTYNKMAEESHEIAKFRFGRKIDKIIEEAKHNKFRKAKLKCRCANCNHREPWSMMSFTSFEAFIAWIGVMLVPISGIAFLDGDIPLGLSILLCSPATFIGWSLLKKFFYFLSEIRISRLQKKSLPTLFLTYNDKMVILNPDLENEKKLEEKNNSEMFAESDVKGISDNTFFCRKCGSKILNDSIFCDKCGSKVKRI